MNYIDQLRAHINDELNVEKPKTNSPYHNWYMVIPVEKYLIKCLILQKHNFFVGENIEKLAKFVVDLSNDVFVPSEENCKYLLKCIKEGFFKPEKRQYNDVVNIISETLNIDKKRVYYSHPFMEEDSDLELD